MVDWGDPIGVVRARGPGPLCPDCPAVLGGVLSTVVQEAAPGCLLDCVAVPARGLLPQRWAVVPALALVRRGILVRQRVDASGGATAIDAVGPGGLLPLRDAGKRGAATYAASHALLCILSARDLADALGRSPVTARDVLALQSHALDRIERLADARGRKTAAARVAALLVALAETLTPRRRLDVVPADLQQRDLAALLGLRHESVCRELGKLERAGVVVREPEGVRIADRAKLEALG